MRYALSDSIATVPSVELEVEGGTRARIVAAAVELLDEHGEDALSTRAVSAAAGVQAPTIYRLFGDKDGLLDAVATAGFEAYLAHEVVRESTDDPVADLRTGWDLHVGLALERPALYRMMYTRPRGGIRSSAAHAAFVELAALVHRVALAGRLRVDEGRAAALLHASGSGVALALIASSPEKPDLGLSHASREAVIAAITTDSPSTPHPGATGAAVALSARLDGVAALSAAERTLLREWLDRIAAAPTFR